MTEPQQQPPDETSSGIERMVMDYPVTVTGVPEWQRRAEIERRHRETSEQPE